MLLEMTELMPVDKMSEGAKDKLKDNLDSGTSVLNIVSRPIYLNSKCIKKMWESPFNYNRLQNNKVQTSQSFRCVAIKLTDGDEIFVKADSLDALKMELALKGQKLI